MQQSSVVWVFVLGFRLSFFFFFTFTIGKNLTHYSAAEIICSLSKIHIVATFDWLLFAFVNLRVQATPGKEEQRMKESESESESERERERERESVRVKSEHLAEINHTRSDTPS